MCFTGNNDDATIPVAVPGGIAAHVADGNKPSTFSPDDGVVTVDGDAAEVERRDGAEVGVEGVPQVADPVAEVPLARQLDRRVEGHGEDRHQEISHSQGDLDPVLQNFFVRNLRIFITSWSVCPSKAFPS